MKKLAVKKRTTSVKYIILTHYSKVHITREIPNIYLLRDWKYDNIYNHNLRPI